MSGTPKSMKATLMTTISFGNDQPNSIGWQL